RAQGGGRSRAVGRNVDRPGIDDGAIAEIDVAAGLEAGACRADRIHRIGGLGVAGPDVVAGDDGKIAADVEQPGAAGGEDDIAARGDRGAVRNADRAVVDIDGDGAARCVVPAD